MIGDLPSTREVLAIYTTEVLLAEVARRTRALQDEVHGAPLCHECRHFVFWKGKRDPPDSYNPCSKGHVMDFKMPEDFPEGDDWGHFRRGCEDRSDKAAPLPPAHPPPDPPPKRGGRPRLAAKAEDR